MADSTANDLQMMTFTIEGDVNVSVTISELDSGDLQFTVNVLDDTGSIGDLNGLFFDLFDPSMLDGLSVEGTEITAEKYDEGDVDNLGGGVNVKGELTQDEGFDGGIRFGTSGMAKDDIQETTFTMSHDSMDLMLEDFYGSDFGVRLTSVGEEDGSRDGSLKLGGTAPDAPDEPVIEEPPVDNNNISGPEEDDTIVIIEDNPVIDPIIEPPMEPNLMDVLSLEPLDENVYQQVIVEEEDPFLDMMFS